MDVELSWVILNVCGAKMKEFLFDQSQEICDINFDLFPSTVSGLNINFIPKNHLQKLHNYKHIKNVNFLISHSPSALIISDEAASATLWPLEIINSLKRLCYDDLRFRVRHLISGALLCSMENSFEFLITRWVEEKIGFCWKLKLISSRSDSGMSLFLVGIRGANEVKMKFGELY